LPLGVWPNGLAKLVRKRGAMLVLTRKTNQSIMIGDDVEVSVLAVAGDKVRIGISAPREVPVFRKEVYLSIQAENADAAEGAGKRVNQALDEMKSS
jgi:carbon storage regulator